MAGGSPGRAFLAFPACPKRARRRALTPRSPARSGTPNSWVDAPAFQVLRATERTDEGDVAGAPVLVGPGSALVARRRQSAAPAPSKKCTAARRSPTNRLTRAIRKQ